MKLDLRAAGETESQLQAEQRGRGEERGGARASSRREELSTHGRKRPPSWPALMASPVDGSRSTNTPRGTNLSLAARQRGANCQPGRRALAAGECLQHRASKETDQPLQRRRRGGRSGDGSRSGRAGRRSRDRAPAGRSPRTRWQPGCQPGLRARVLGSAVVEGERGEARGEMRTRRRASGRRAGWGRGRTDLEGDELAHDRARAVSPVLEREDEEQEAAPSAGASWFRSHLSLCSCPAV